MTKTFIGIHVDSAHALYYYRTLYENEAYTNDGDGGPAIKDFIFAENQYYGAINTGGSSVIPNEDMLVSTGKKPSDPKVFDFMVDMFVDTKATVELCRLNGTLDVKISDFAKLEAKNAYESPQRSYNNYFSQLLMEYNLSIPRTYGLKNTLGFYYYVMNFFHWIENYKMGETLTLTGWMASNRASIFHTGLGISISEKIKVHDDQKKFNEFINNPSFDYYQKLLMNNGFSISKNAPHIIVPDLGSPAINLYYNKYNISNIDDLFNKYYIKTKTLDIKYIKDNIIKYYNLFVSKNPVQRFFTNSLCKPSSPPIGATVLDGGWSSGRWLPKTDWFYYKRPHIVEKDADNVITEQNWLSMYLYFRNFEQNRPYEDGHIAKFNNNMKNIHKKLDKSAAIDYIDSKMRKFVFKREYGFRDHLRRIKEADEKATKDMLSGKDAFDVGGGGY